MVINELANIWPELSTKDFEEFCKDIQEKGLLDPIATYRGEIIDGRHRYNACIKLGIEPRFKEIDGNDPYGFVFSKNNVRRNLSEIDKAIAARKLANIKQGLNVRHIDESDNYIFDEEVARATSLDDIQKNYVSIDEAAIKLDIGRDSIIRATPIVNNGSDELLEAIKEKEITNITLAGEIAKLPKEEQKEILYFDDEKAVIKKADEIKKRLNEKKHQEKTEKKQKKIEEYNSLPEPSKNELYENFKEAYRLGDSTVELKKLEDNSIDLVWTDVPYGIDYKNSRRQYGRLPTADGIANDGEDNLNLLETVAIELFRTLKYGRHLYWCGRADVIYPQIQMLKDVGFNVKNVLIWVKNNHGVGDTNYFAPRYEVIVFAIKDARNVKGIEEKNRPLNQTNGRLDDVLFFDRVSDLIHDHQKPEGLIQTLVQESSNPGEIVLDPFAGSGSTLMAALKVKRKALGWELDKTIHDHSLGEWLVKTNEEQQ